MVVIALIWQGYDGISAAYGPTEALVEVNEKLEAHGTEKVD